MQPSEIEELPYYELEYIIETLVDILEKKKEAEEGDGEGMKEKQSEYMSQAKGMMSKHSTPKMPNMPSTTSFPSMPSNLKI